MLTLNPLVLYSTKNGSTQKIAHAISSQINAQTIQITNPAPTVELTDYDLIFVGTGIRAGNPFPEMVSYLNTIELPEPKTFAVFITWGGAGKTNEKVSTKIKTILESKNQKVVDGFFSSYGKWNMRKSTRPNDDDVSAAKTWAQNVIKTASK